MAVDGTYNVEIDTPLGKRSGKLTLKTDGGSLSGKYLTELGEQSFEDGTVSGDEFSFSVTTNTLMGEMKLDFKGTVSGDTASGVVQAGSLGTYPFQGTRA